jgi:hypothetical protein
MGVKFYLLNALAKVPAAINAYRRVGGLVRAAVNLRTRPSGSGQEFERCGSNRGEGAGSSLALLRVRIPSGHDCTRRIA